MEKSDISLRSINMFVTVAECGGVARAAELLSYTQPAVTMQLRQLEERLGVILFRRSSRPIQLTLAGTAALEPARSILRSLVALQSEALSAIDERPAPLIIGAIEPSASLRLPSVISRLRKTMPEARIKIGVTGGDNIARAAKEGSIHVALTVPTEVEGWIYEPLFRERFVLLVRPDHRFASKSSVGLSQLKSEPLVLTDETCAYRRSVQRAFARHGATGVSVVESSTVISLPHAVAAGLGVAVVPKPLAATFSNLCMVAIRERVEMTIGLLRPRVIESRSALQRFVDSAYSLKRR